MRVNGKELAVEINGDGQPVVLVHGLGGTLNFYQPQVAELRSRFRVIRFDLEGSGRSPRTGPLGIDGWVADLLAVLNATDCDSVGLVGHSMGTLIAQQFAARYPDRVNKLVLLGAVPAPTEAVRQAQHDRAAAVRAGGMVTVADTVVAAATSISTQRERPEVAAFVRELLMGQNPESYAQSCEALGAAADPDTAAIKAPVLLICGADDKVGSPAAARNYADRVHGDATIHIVDGCGHWICIEAPAQVTAALLSFL